LKALFNRGFSHDKVGNFDAAIADYSAALKVILVYEALSY
jgi:hypothetical protein